MRNLVLVCVLLVTLGIPGQYNANKNQSLLTLSKSGLEMDHYHFRGTCRDFSSIIRDLTWKHVRANPRLPAELLRLHFHDCFVRGCNGSVLLDTVAGGHPSEKEAIPNRSLAGLDVIDEIKAKLEQECPETVSCADILALAARDAISFQFQKPLWEVATGRRDGRISRASEASVGIPSPFSNFTTLETQFASRSLTVRDLVALSGAHTIGRGHCSLFTSRLYNFSGRGDADPSLSPSYAALLRAQCTPSDTVTTVEMDPGSSKVFDSQYYSILKHKKGLFRSDAALLTDRAARVIAAEFVNSRSFLDQFSSSVKKMGEIQLLTGNQGEIRKNCRVVN